MIQENVANQTVSVENDSIAPADTIVDKAIHSALVIDNHHSGRPGGVRPDYLGAGSWIMLIMLILFGYLSMKYRGNMIYFRSLFRQLLSARVRDNLFDDTVRETFFIILLNLLGAISGGLLMYYSLPVESGSASRCILLACGYVVLMPIAYIVCGTVFSNYSTAVAWLRGATAGGAILGPILAVAALPALFNPTLRIGLVIFGLIAFILVKISFIIKSFRIFFIKSTSWLLFLYYLCILEVIPLILIYALGGEISTHA